MVEPVKGDVISIRDWNGEVLSLLVQELHDSSKYGRCVSGNEMESHRQKTLPLSNRIESVHVENVGWGKWDIHLPDGEVERLGSKQKAKDRIAELGFQEV